MFAWSSDWTIFLPLRKIIFKSVDFWNSLSSTVLDKEFADINVVKELRVSVDGKVQGYSFRHPKK